MELMQNESLVWQGRPSWRAALSFYLKWVVLGLVPVVAGVAIDHFRDKSSLAGWGALASAVIIALALLVGWLRRISTLYTITDRRIVIRHGILARREHEAHIDRVQNVNINQTFLDRILKVGSLDFDTAGTEDADFRFVGISDPDRLRRRVNEEYVARSREMGTQVR